MLHKLRQLGLYTNTGTPDTAYQVHVVAAPAEVAYSRTKKQPSCSGGGESDRRIPSTRPWQVYAIIHDDAGQRPDQPQGGTSGADRTSTMEAELVVAALAMKEAVFLCNMMLELGFDESFGSVSLYIDNTSTLHAAGNRTFTPRAKHIALSYFFVQELVEEGNISIHYVKSEDQLADLGN